MKKPESDLTKQLNSIVKTKKLLSRDYIEEKWVGGFIIRRFISFIDTDIDTLQQIVGYINTLHLSSIKNNWEEYLFLYSVIPQLRNARFNYISKPKIKPNKKLEEKINLFAEELEITKKEAKYLIEQGYLDIKL